MLELKGIKKDYVSQNETVHALKGVDLSFGDSEFVAVLGPSGCGKTTLLNIIGGLDRYTEGDLIINGKSTKTYKDRDWDAYRNHSIGFVFQSYNLIPHQTVLANVELALTLSGVSKAERRRRAEEVLERVGLKDQIRKKPNQLSGGQMQRVAIARALVNDPETILADEPTGALDSGTSVQIMELLKEVSRDRLVIMVTHNSDLADTYATRIVKLLDGLIVSNEENAPAEPARTAEEAGPEKKRVSMSFLTALSLSLNNLMTKKARTVLTEFAGSIGIIGIALILSISDGFQNYIDRVQEDTLSNYPLTIDSEVMDLSSLFSREAKDERPDKEHKDGLVYSNGRLSEGVELMNSNTRTNDLASFKKYIEGDGNALLENTNGVQYLYDIDVFIYNRSAVGGTAQANPGVVYDMMFGSSFSAMMSMSSNAEAFSEMIDNIGLLDTQYDVLTGRWPEKYDELVLVVDKYDQIGDFQLYTLGLRDQSKLEGIMERIMAGESEPEEQLVFTYDELMSIDFVMLPPTAFYEKDERGFYADRRETDDIDAILADAGVPLKIVGIVRPKDGAAATALNGTVCYTGALTEYVINAVNESEIVKAQIADPDTDIFTGIPFNMGDYTPTKEDVLNYISTLPEEQQAQILPYIDMMSEEELIARFASEITPAATKNTYDGNLKTLGVNELDKPSSVVIYPIDFAAKDKVKSMIDKYNDDMKASGEDGKVLTYTDYVGLLMSSVSTIINIISYVLIAFVAVSLVVSSIMIGVITNISVLERTKEIGVLRSIGASKRDISRVFNAETLIIGFISGVIGIGLTLLLIIPINAIIYKLGGIRTVAALPWKGAVILLIISRLLTLIAGLIPSRAAAKKDPVVALRTE